MNQKQHQKVVFKQDAHKELLKGSKILAEAVISTMGPGGHSVIIDRDNGSPLITKDGVSVARSINLSNRLQSMGAELLKEVASKTNDIAGDGTTTATCLAYHLLKEGHKLISTGRSAIDLKFGMEHASKIVLEFLKENCIPVSGKQDIVNVGTISANGDTEIGELIAEAIEKVGSDGLITVEPAKSIKTTLKIAEGMQLNSGFVSPFFITNGDKQTCELEDPYVLITTNKLSSLKDIIPILEQIDNVDKPLLIVADEIEGECLHTLVVNKTKGIIKVCAVKAPSYGEHRADLLADLSVVVGGSVIGATSELSVKQLKLEHLGKCKKVTVSRTGTTFIIDQNNKSVSEKIKIRSDEIRTALTTDHTLDELRVSRFRDRLARLSGGIAVISVGGSSEVEIKELLDRVVDSVGATQAAAQMGVVPGGGTALYYASQHLKSMIKAGFFSTMCDDEIAGIGLLANAIESPFNAIVSNTGMSPEIIADKLIQNWAETKTFSVDMNLISTLTDEEVKDFFNNLKSKETDLSVSSYKKKFRFGYNASKEVFEDLISTGILDPVKVTLSALEHSVSVIGLVLTTDAVIVNEEIE
jgi:chaperonin GroEL